MKFDRAVTPKHLKEIAASIRELATTLEARNDLKCVQAATLKTRKAKGRLDMDVSFRFSLVEERDIREANETIEIIK